MTNIISFQWTPNIIKFFFELGPSLKVSGSKPWRIFNQTVCASGPQISILVISPLVSSRASGWPCGGRPGAAPPRWAWRTWSEITWLTLYCAGGPYYLTLPVELGVDPEPDHARPPLPPHLLLPRPLPLYLLADVFKRGLDKLPEKQTRSNFVWLSLFKLVVQESSFVLSFNLLH